MEVEAAATGEVKLLGVWASPFVLRVEIALKLKGINYEYIKETMVPKSELLLKSNPVYKKIPVLFHGDKIVCESMIIVQYIDEVWGGEGPSILPSDSYDRALARFWVSYIDDKLPLMLGILKEQTEEVVANATAGLQVLEEAVEKCSKGGKFFRGDTIGYIDIALGGFLGWIEAVKELSGVELLDELKTPHIVSWAKNFRLNDVVNEVLPGTEKFVELGKMLQTSSWAQPSY